MKKVMILGAALFLTACSGQQFTQQLSPGKLVGAAAGAFVGGYAGSQVGGGVGRLLFTVAGAVIGGGAGYSIGEQLLPSDRTQFRRSAQFAMSNSHDGHLTNWSNPKTGVVGTIKPIRTYYAGGDVFCRDFQASIAVRDQVGQANGRACKSGGNTWHLDNRV